MAINENAQVGGSGAGSFGKAAGNVNCTRCGPCCPRWCRHASLIVDGLLIEVEDLRERIADREANGNG